MSSTAATLPRILAAGPGDRAEVMRTLTAAFEADPAVRALYPVPGEARRHFPGFAEAFGGGAFTLGVVDRDADGLGAALWYPPGVDPDPAPVIAHLEATLDPARQPAIFAGLELQSGLHPHAPHWYLPFIGVRPEAQGSGIGAALLAHGLARADADRLPAYVEATSRRSVPFYVRHGFEVVGVVEGEGYPEIFALWRPAQR
jgi:ribosomal protein S18 acetylase RimI-like enzyme